jgi:hypothetical protein
MLGAYAHRKLGSTRITVQIGLSVIAEHKWLFVSSLEALVRTAIFVVNNDKIASRKGLVKL